MVSYRSAAIASIRDLSASLPPSAPVGLPPFLQGLRRVCLISLSFPPCPDVLLTPIPPALQELPVGIPIDGPVESSSTLRDRPRNARTSFDEWKRAIPETNTRAIGRIKKKQGSAASSKCWESALAEVERGWVTQPIPLAAEISAELPLTPLFAIEEHHGVQNEKYAASMALKLLALMASFPRWIRKFPTPSTPFWLFPTYYSLFHRGRICLFSPKISHARINKSAFPPAILVSLLSSSGPPPTGCSSRFPRYVHSHSGSGELVILLE